MFTFLSKGYWGVAHESYRLTYALEQLARSRSQVNEVLGASRPIWTPLQALLQLSEAVAVFSAGMASGQSGLVNAAVSKISDLRQGTAIVPSLFWLCARVLDVIEHSAPKSIFSVLPKLGLPRDYLDMLSQTGVAELWDSQISAINEGLLDEKGRHFVIRMPTGAGKTLLAELALVQSLTRHPDSWAIYVVPTRALVHQVEDDLSRRLPRVGITIRSVLAGDEPVVTIQEEMTKLVLSQTITVVTPEKLDIYYRAQPELFDSCQMLVVDEAHKIGEPGRGPLLESLVTRFLTRHSKCRILAMSAALGNASEIAKWLGPETKLFEDDTRPTRQSMGLAIAYHARPRPARESRSRQKDLRRRLDFDGGVVLVYRDEDLAAVETLEIDLPELFRGHFTQRYIAQRWLIDDDLPHSNPVDHGIAIAKRLHRLPGTTLLFFPRKDSAERCARDVAASLNQTQSPPLIALGRYLSDVLGGDHELCSLVFKGVAYHHSGLPRCAQRVIEIAMRRNAGYRMCYADIKRGSKHSHIQGCHRRDYIL